MKQNKKLLRLLCTAAAILMIGIGVLRGEASEICTKAVKICLECIGIG